MKACFAYSFKQKIFDILWVTLGYVWIYILKCISWFVSIILNFNGHCNAYTVQIQSYAVLLKSNRIFLLMLGISFGNYFLPIYNECDDPLWLYFVYFLNYPPMYEEIDC